ncbi:MAG: hypothetical protein GXP49_01895 [Deltaproteobacteria bacterium]|nr:hypothetical protein [Deltaproteobacteria bacterium]
MKRTLLSTFGAVLLILLGLMNTVGGIGWIWGRTMLAMGKLGSQAQEEQITTNEAVRAKIQRLEKVAPVLGAFTLLFGICAIVAGAAVLALKPWSHILAVCSMAGAGVVTLAYGMLLHFGLFTVFFLLLYAFTAVAVLYSKQEAS